MVVVGDSDSSPVAIKLDSNGTKLWEWNVSASLFNRYESSGHSAYGGGVWVVSNIGNFPKFSTAKQFGSHRKQQIWEFLQKVGSEGPEYWERKLQVFEKFPTIFPSPVNSLHNVPELRTVPTIWIELSSFESRRTIVLLLLDR